MAEGDQKSSGSSSDRTADTWNLHLDSETGRELGARSSTMAPVPSLVVLYHPDLTRIGECAPLNDFDRGARLSRTEPVFHGSFHDDYRPLADVRLTWQFNVRSFVRFTTQYFDIRRNPDVYVDTVDRREKDLGRQLLFSYKLNPQTVFFLGYSDALIQDDNLDSLETSDRTWFAKIGYAWTP